MDRLGNDCLRRRTGAHHRKLSEPTRAEFADLKCPLNRGGQLPPPYRLQVFLITRPSRVPLTPILPFFLIH